MPNYYTTPSPNGSADLESKTKEVDVLIKEIDTLATQKEAIDKKMAAPDEETDTLAKLMEVIDIEIADRVKAIDKIYSPSLSNNGEAVASNLKEDEAIQAIQAIQEENNTTSKKTAAPGSRIKIKEIPIDHVAPELADSNLNDSAIVKCNVAIGTKMRIIESYRSHAIESYKKLTPSSDEVLKLTVDMRCNRVIESTWKELLSDPSQVKFLADNEIIDLYSSIRGAKLIHHFKFNFQHYFKNYFIKSTSKKITIKTTAVDGDLELGDDKKDGPMDRMVTVLDGDGHEVVIGTIFELYYGYDNYNNKKSRAGVTLCPEVVKVSATRKSIDSYWSNYGHEPLHKSPMLEKGTDDYCSYYYSKRGTELVNSNFMVDEHEVVIDESFNPSLDICLCFGLQQRGKDMADSNEHEAIISATAQEHDSFLY